MLGAATLEFETRLFGFRPLAGDFIEHDPHPLATHPWSPRHRLAD